MELVGQPDQWSGPNPTALGPLAHSAAPPAPEHPRLILRSSLLGSRSMSPSGVWKSRLLMPLLINHPQIPTEPAVDIQYMLLLFPGWIHRASIVVSMKDLQYHPNELFCVFQVPSLSPSAFLSILSSPASLSNISCLLSSPHECVWLIFQPLKPPVCYFFISLSLCFPRAAILYSSCLPQFHPEIGSCKIEHESSFIMKLIFLKVCHKRNQIKQQPPLLFYPLVCRFFFAAPSCPLHPSIVIHLLPFT